MFIDEDFAHLLLYISLPKYCEQSRKLTVLSLEASRYHSFATKITRVYL